MMLRDQLVKREGLPIALADSGPHSKTRVFSAKRAVFRWGTTLHHSVLLGAALRAARFALQICRTQLVSCSRVRIFPSITVAAATPLRGRGAKGRAGLFAAGDSRSSLASLGTALRASRFAPQICRTRLFSSSRIRIPRWQRHALGKHADEEPEVKFGGREGFIPLPEVHELQRFSNIPEYPYLRKYPPKKRRLKRCDGSFFITTEDLQLRSHSGVVHDTHDPVSALRICPRSQRRLTGLDSRVGFTVVQIFCVQRILGRLLRTSGCIVRQVRQCFDTSQCSIHAAE